MLRRRVPRLSLAVTNKDGYCSSFSDSIHYCVISFRFLAVYFIVSYP